MLLFVIIELILLKLNEQSTSISIKPLKPALNQCFLVN